MRRFMGFGRDIEILVSEVLFRVVVSFFMGFHQLSCFC